MSGGVLPGEDVSEVLLEAGAVDLKVGAGLRYASGPSGEDCVLSTQLGVLRGVGGGSGEEEGGEMVGKRRVWVDGVLGRRYSPRVGDAVVGMVTDRNAEFYRVNFNASVVGLLPLLAFDGATKRHRPRLEPGALVYCRVAAVDRHLEPELSCAVESGPKKDWVTGESVYGELVGGTTLRVSLPFATHLLSSPCPVLDTLAEFIPFELAIGRNGRVWVRAATPRDTVLARVAILHAEQTPPEKCPEMVRNIVKAIATKK